MMSAPAVAPLSITGAGAVSPVGIGLSALTQALEKGYVGYQGPVDEADNYPPAMPAWAVSDSPLAERLGRKGLQGVDRMSRIALVACQQALERAGGLSEQERAEIGVAMATAGGSMRSLSEVGLDTVRNEKPYMVNPRLFPNVVMNSCAGQLAIKNGLHGANATLSAGQVSSLAAFRYARIALADHRVSRILAGGVEELSPIGSWGWHLSGVLVEGTAVGEGSAMFMLEDSTAASEAGRVSLGEILACEIGYAGTDDGSSIDAPRAVRGLAAVIERALRRSAVTADDLDLVVPGCQGQPTMAEVEEEATELVLGRPVKRLDVVPVIGQCYSASGALQTAALLGYFEGRADWTALVTSAGEEGTVGALVVRGTGG
jgi:3-oxoacyl-[acyl-carrier-protein] synthase II